LALLPAAQAQFNCTTHDNSVAITGYAGPGGAVTIPATIHGLPVTAIGDSAFSGAGLTGVAMPDSVTNIGDYAFVGCSSLAAVAIGNHVTRIGDAAFSACWSLTNVAIPDSVTRLGDNAFDHCSSLTAVTIGNHVTTIGQSAFACCYSLADVSIPDRVADIGAMAFEGCGALSTLTIGGGVTNIGAGAFDNCANLTSLTLPKSLASIGNNAFAGCASLRGIYFLGNAPGIGVAADNVLSGGGNPTVYYLPGTTGWGPTFAGFPTVLWNPRMRTDDPGSGFRSNGVGFTITASPNIVVVVEASTDLANWSPLAQLTLTGGSSHWSDPQWTNYPSRFYRLRSP
jgi:hypothetical protein